MLNFEHFFKRKPAIYPRAPPFQISKYATVDSFERFLKAILFRRY